MLAFVADAGDETVADIGAAGRAGAVSGVDDDIIIQLEVEIAQRVKQLLRELLGLVITQQIGAADGIRKKAVSAEDGERSIRAVAFRRDIRHMFRGVPRCVPSGEDHSAEIDLVSISELFMGKVNSGECQLLDNRQMLAFGGGHIDGAINIGPKAELSIWAGWLLDPEKPILLVLPKDSDLLEVERQLIRVGYSKFAGYLVGGIESWVNAGFPLKRLTQMTVLEVNEALPPKDLQVVDVRSPSEWQSGHVPGAKYIFLPELEESVRKLDKKKPIAVYCDSGYRASVGASLLARQGFTDVRNVPGSWKAWKAAELPVEVPKEEKEASDTDR